MDVPPAIDAAFNRMEIVGPSDAHTISWYGRLAGPAGEVADLIMVARE